MESRCEHRAASGKGALSPHPRATKKPDNNARGVDACAEMNKARAFTRMAEEQAHGGRRQTDAQRRRFRTAARRKGVANAVISVYGA